MEVVKVYIRYDGGNDEGIAWFDHGVMKDGSVRSAEQIATDLDAVGARSSLGAEGTPMSTREMLDWTVATTWAMTLLGDGYGTGEYVMYGAFFVDLESGSVTDDPRSAPVVKNISLKAK